MINTKEVILKASQNLFARFGLKKTTVDEIAKLAHIGKGTIYHYFKTKEQIFAEIIDKESRYLREKIYEAIQQAKTPQEKFRAFVLTRMRFLKELANYYSALKDDYLRHYPFIEKARRESFQEELNLVKSILEEGIALKVFAVEDAGLTAFAIVTALKGLEYPWTVETSLSDIEKSVNSLINVLFKGIETR
jgi:AcrR family transcriptional regulator